jgi:hypothetical protein
MDEHSKNRAILGVRFMMSAGFVGKVREYWQTNGDK